jgi:hypothetical protein
LDDIDVPDRDLSIVIPERRDSAEPGIQTRILRLELDPGSRVSRVPRNDGRQLSATLTELSGSSWPKQR